LAGLGGKPDQLAPDTVESVRTAVLEFFGDLYGNRLRSAYDSMSVAYKGRESRQNFDQFIAQHPSLREASGGVVLQKEYYKVRKLGKDDVYECDCPSAAGSNLVTLRPIREKGAWRIDEFVEFKERK
jgi:hypothetical protein